MHTVLVLYVVFSANKKKRVADSDWSLIVSTSPSESVKGFITYIYIYNKSYKYLEINKQLQACNLPVKYSSTKFIHIFVDKDDLNEWQIKGNGLVLLSLEALNCII